MTYVTLVRLIMALMSYGVPLSFSPNLKIFKHVCCKPYIVFIHLKPSVSFCSINNAVCELSIQIYISSIQSGNYHFIRWWQCVAIRLINSNIKEVSYQLWSIIVNISDCNGCCSSSLSVKVQRQVIKNQRMMTFNLHVLSESLL